MKNNAAVFLKCPVCGQTMKPEERRVYCANRHSFDYAKEGYLNLFLTNKKGHGDAVESIRARKRFLSGGYYGFLETRLRQLSGEVPHEVTVDLGCGEGYYTAALAGDLKYGFDLSKEGLRLAAKSDQNTQYIVASIFHLPLQSACADLVMTCFAPAAEKEVERILKPGGIFLYVTPGKEHLFELKELLYETPYKNDIVLPETGLKKIHEETLRDRFTVDQKVLQDLFEMTPYAHHTPDEGRNRLKAVSEMTITGEFLIRMYQKSY